MGCWISLYYFDWWILNLVVVHKIVIGYMNTHSSGGFNAGAWFECSYQSSSMWKFVMCVSEECHWLLHQNADAIIFYGVLMLTACWVLSMMQYNSVNSNHAFLLLCSPITTLLLIWYNYRLVPPCMASGMMKVKGWWNTMLMKFMLYPLDTIC